MQYNPEKLEFRILLSRVTHSHSLHISFGREGKNNVHVNSMFVTFSKKKKQCACVGGLLKFTCLEFASEPGQHSCNTFIVDFPWKLFDFVLFFPLHHAKQNIQGQVENPFENCKAFTWKEEARKWNKIYTCTGKYFLSQTKFVLAYELIYA